MYVNDVDDDDDDALHMNRIEHEIRSFELLLSMFGLVHAKLI